MTIDDSDTLRAMERENDLPVNTIQPIQWIKPLERRSPDQHTAHTIIEFFRPAETSLAIKNDLLILGKRCSSQELLLEPTQCMKCQSFRGHYAKTTKAYKIHVEHALENTILKTVQLYPQTSTTAWTAKLQGMQPGIASATPLLTSLSTTTRTYCQNRFPWWTLMKAEEGGGVYASLGTRQEGRGFEDVGLSICASPLWILVLRFQRAESQRSAVGPKVSGGIRETEETEEFMGSIQCNIRTEELPPQHAEVIYYDSGYIE